MIELPRRWTQLRWHETQQKLLACPARFCVIEAGRRSGKTELAKRDGVEHAIQPHPDRPGYFVGFFAPTRDQAKELYWEDLKELSWPWWSRKPSETELRIHLMSGAQIRVIGMDKPARMEGRPIDRCYVDETAEMKAGTWDRHLRPALATVGRLGSGWIYGVPRPGADFKKLVDLALDPAVPDYSYFHWTAEGVVPPEEVAAAKREMDPLLYEQEFLAHRVNFAGLAYYRFSREHNASTLVRQHYRPEQPLILCLDFNWKPGTATIVQELPMPGEPDERLVTCVLDEIWLPGGSTTPTVCRQFLERWGEHPGPVRAYGDATGGSSGSAKVEGSDWTLVEKLLGPAFEGRFHTDVPRENPPQRARINTVNWRLRAADETVSMLVDPECRHTVEDFESVTLVEGTGEINKGKGQEMWTHLTDGLGYYLHREFPLEDRLFVDVEA